MEKELVELVSWQGKKQAAVIAGSNEALQEEIIRLQEYQGQLENYQMESQRTINNLQSMLDHVKILRLPVEEQQKQNHIERFDDTSRRNHDAMLLLHEMKNLPSRFPSSLRKKMESQLNILEIELTKSDQYIMTLKKELKEAQSRVANYGLMLRDALVADDAPQISLNNSYQNLDAVGQQKIQYEIEQLRKNNVKKHHIIGELEQEIQALRDSLNAEPGDERNVKEEEIKRLEQLVRECQACIKTLESEVDSLYAQLQGRAEKQTEALPVQVNSEINEELSMITHELEKTVAHYQQLHAINYMMIDIIKSSSVEDLGRQLEQFIKTFRAPIGFSINSSLNKVEYYPADRFDDALKSLIKASNFVEPLTHMSKGSLFVNSRIRLMLLPSVQGDHPILETSLATLVGAIEECVKRIEREKMVENRQYNTREWTDLTKNLLTNLDIQYAYQVEENRKTFNNFIAELRSAYHLLDLNGPGGVVLDNAINEFEERIHGLIASSETIDDDISKLLRHMDKLDV